MYKKNKKRDIFCVTGSLYLKVTFDDPFGSDL